MNASIQCLLQSRLIIERLGSITNLDTIKSEERGMYWHFSKFLQQYHTNKYQMLLLPTFLFQSLLTNCRDFKVGRQYDAVDFLTELLDALETSGTCSNYFRIAMTSTLRCKECSFESSQNETDSILRLPLGNTLSEAMSLFFNKEDISDVYCSRCKVNRVQEKTTSLSSTSEILIIQQKLFDRFLNKVKSRLSFPLDDFEPAASTGVYELFGIINHIGDYDSGHYVSMVKDMETNKWYKCSDSNVNPTSNNVIFQSPNNYVLFYSRKNKYVYF